MTHLYTCLCSAITSSYKYHESPESQHIQLRAASSRGVRISAAVCETCASLSPQAKQKNYSLKLPAISSVSVARHTPQIFSSSTSKQKLMILHEHQLPLAVAGNSRPKVPPMWLGTGLIRVDWHECTRSILFAFQLL